MSSPEYGNYVIKDLIDGHLEDMPDFDSHLLQLSQLKVDTKHLVADVDCFNTNGEIIDGHSSRLFKKEGKLDEFKRCNDQVIKCYEEIKQLEVMTLFKQLEVMTLFKQLEVMTLLRTSQLGIYRLTNAG